MAKKNKKPLIKVLVLLIISVGIFLAVKKTDFFQRQQPGLADNQRISNSQSDPYVSNNSDSSLSNASSSASSNSPPVQPGQPKSILLNVPFFSQAPYGEWSDLIFENACEEASAIMAMHWVNQTTVTRDQAKQEILALTEFEDKTYGQAYDRSAQDATKMIKDYFGYSAVSVKLNISTKDIKQEILKSHLIIVPVNGQILKNPYYSGAGPYHHMLVVIGFDDKTDEFITNDVGTRHGQNYRYAESRFQASLQDYPTGYNLPSVPGATAMIVVLPK